LVHNNQAISRDLQWAKDHILTDLNSIILLCELDWSPKQAEVKIFCDASHFGMGFWLPHVKKGFYIIPPSRIPSGIFFRKALCVASALDYALTLPIHHHMVIYTDNGNTVDIFSSLHAPPVYNSILKYSVDIMIWQDIQLKVFHVPGQYNQVANALSWLDFSCIHQLVPGILITSFTPPRNALGAAKK
jgi:hypothetical protein